MSLLVKSPDFDAEVKLADNIVIKSTTILLFNNFMYSIFINQHFRQQQYTLKWLALFLHRFCVNIFMQALQASNRCSWRSHNSLSSICWQLQLSAWHCDVDVDRCAVLRHSNPDADVLMRIRCQSVADHWNWHQFPVGIDHPWWTHESSSNLALTGPIFLLVQSHFGHTMTNSSPYCVSIKPPLFWF